MVILAKKQVKEGQIYATNKEITGKQYIYTVKSISSKTLVLRSNTNKESTQDIKDTRELNFINADLIKSYNTWQEAVNSKEFKTENEQ